MIKGSGEDRGDSEGCTGELSDGAIEIGPTNGTTTGSRDGSYCRAETLPNEIKLDMQFPLAPSARQGVQNLKHHIKIRQIGLSSQNAPDEEPSAGGIGTSGTGERLIAVQCIGGDDGVHLSKFEGSTLTPPTTELVGGSVSVIGSDIGDEMATMEEVRRFENAHTNTPAVTNTRNPNAGIRRIACLAIPSLLVRRFWDLSASC